MILHDCAIDYQKSLSLEYYPHGENSVIMIHRFRTNNIPELQKNSFTDQILKKWGDKM